MTIILSIFAFFLLSFLVYWRLGANTELQTVNYTVSGDKISSAFRIAVVADLHSCQYGEGQTELVEAIETQKPDLVLLAGDIYDDKLPDEAADTFLKTIGGRFRCYYIPGNHEYRKTADDSMEKLLEKVSSYGITVLLGECETVTVNGNDVNICGLMERVTGTQFAEQSKLEHKTESSLWQEAFSELCDGADNGNYSILLAHRPGRIDTYLTGGFDLIVAGHAHGGQWRIPGVLNGVIAPDEGLLPKYAGGEYDFETATLIVSRGLARESTFVPRIFNPPELVIIDILPENT